jgi:hypothetical protein
MLTKAEIKRFRVDLAYFQQHHGKGKVATDLARREFWRWYSMNRPIEADTKETVMAELEEVKG